MKNTTKRIHVSSIVYFDKMFNKLLQKEQIKSNRRDSNMPTLNKKQLLFQERNMVN